MRYFIPILLMLLLSPVVAQDETPLPVLQAEDIFAEGVTVLERLPTYDSNQNLREIYHFNPETLTWETFTYPETIGELYTIFPHRVSETYGYVVSGETNTLWLNVETGLYQELPRTCGIASPLTDEGWNFYMFDEPPNMYLCNSETEARIEIPIEVQEKIVFQGVSSCIGCFLRISPDNHYAFLESESENPAFFVFDLLEETYLYEIPLPENESAWFPVAAGATTYIFRTGNEFGQSLWQVDISQPDSMQRLLSQAQAIDYDWGDIDSIYVLVNEAGELALDYWDNRTVSFVRQMDNLCLFIPSCEELDLRGVSSSRKYVILDNYELEIVYLVDIERNEIMRTLGDADSWVWTSWRDAGGDIITWQTRSISYYLRINEDRSFIIYMADEINESFGLDQIIIRRDSSYFLLDVNTGTEYPIANVPSNVNWQFYFRDDETKGIYVQIRDSSSYETLARWRIQIDALSGDNS